MFHFYMALTSIPVPPFLRPLSATVLWIAKVSACSTIFCSWVFNLVSLTNVSVSRVKEQCVKNSALKFKFTVMSRSYSLHCLTTSELSIPVSLSWDRTDGDNCLFLTTEMRVYKLCSLWTRPTAFHWLLCFTVRGLQSLFSLRIRLFQAFYKMLMYAGMFQETAFCLTIPILKPVMSLEIVILSNTFRGNNSVTPETLFYSHVFSLHLQNNGDGRNTKLYRFPVHKVP
jgi:hypothetical protein